MPLCRPTETFLNIRGIDNVLIAVKEVLPHYLMTEPLPIVYIKVMTIKALLYQQVFNVWYARNWFFGVMFTLDTKSGFRDVVFITSSYGLGEMVVQGAVNPDEFYLHKPTLVAKRPPVLRRNLGK